MGKGCPILTGQLQNVTYFISEQTVYDFLYDIAIVARALRDPSAFDDGLTSFLKKIDSTKCIRPFLALVKEEWNCFKGRKVGQEHDEVVHVSWLTHLEHPLFFNILKVLQESTSFIRRTSEFLVRI